MATLSKLGDLKRALYAGGRPGRLMRLWNRLDARLYATGVLLPDRAAVLKVPGRRSGRVHAVPVAVADLDGAEYLVSMLGPAAGWVLNVEAAGGRAVLRRRGRDTPVHLTPVPVAERAPVLRRYVAIAPGSRPHVSAPPGAPLAQFESIAAAHPTFRIDRPPAERAPGR